MSSNQALKLNETNDTSNKEPKIAFKVGKRPGYIEIYFSTGPCEKDQEELKSAGFRFARYWYGLEANIPNKYKMLMV